MGESLHNLWLRLKAVVKRRQLDRDLAEELEFHLAMREQKLIEQGMPPREAHYAARRGFGNAVSLKETTRDLWSFPSLETILQDVRFGLRQLRLNPGFTTLAVLTLALGIGGTTGIFSVIYGALFKTFPFVDQPPVLQVVSRDRKEAGIDMPTFSAAEVRDFQEQDRMFDAMAGATTWDDVVLTGADLPESWTGARVTGDFFKLLGVPPFIGRVLGPQDAQAGAPPVAVLSHKVWQNSLSGDPKILGRILTLNGRPTTIIGVMPPRFEWNGAGLWLPATSGREETSGDPPRFELYGRLKPGLTVEQAEAEIGALAKRFAASYPKDFPPELAFGVVSLAEMLRHSIRPWFVLLGAVAFLLLMACVNVANLLLARGTAREKETAVRAALGAGRGRLVRQFLMEGLLLALGGAGIGCLLAWGVLELLVSRMSGTIQFIPRGAQIEMNGPALLFALGAACLSTLLFGLAPALLAAGKDLQQPLQSTGRGVGESFGHGRLRDLLAITEVALSLILLTAASLALRSFWGRYQVERGFDASHIMFTTIFLPEERYKTLSQKTQFDLELLRRTRALPGVVSAALESPPLPGYFPATIEITGQPRAEAQRAEVHWTGDRFIETLGIRLLQGRTFSPDDMAQSRRMAVVNQKLVSEYLADETPLGQLIALKEVEGFNVTAAPPQGFEVVGVVADTRLDAWPERPVQPEIYLPFSVGGMASVRLYVRTAVPAEIYSKSVRRAVAAIDQDLPVRETKTLERFLDNLWYAGPRFSTLMFIAVASLGLLLGSVGVYGVLSYTVSRRTKEIGVRMALGAEATDVHRMVMMSGLRWFAVGIGIGIPASIAISMALHHRIWGILPADPLTLVAVSLLLIAVGLAACYFPARRATKVDPMVALRCE